MIKNAIPDSDQNFAFTATGTGPAAFTAGFSLDDDADPGLPNTMLLHLHRQPARDQDDHRDVPAAAGARRTSSAPAMTTAGLPATGVATLDVDAGETIVCTYTNTQDATVRVTKDAIPDSDQNFAYTATGTGPAAFTAGFSLDDDADPGLTNTMLFTFTASQLGTKTITETLPVSGWSPTNLVCTGDDNSSVVPATGVATLDVDAGETIVCTYTNTQRPTIIVKKITTGVAGGPFDFTTTGGNGFDASFTLTTSAPGDAGADSESFLIDIAGIGEDYTVTEGIEPGFVLTDVDCVITTAGAAGTTVGDDLATRTGTISDLSAGTTVTCTFINSGALTTRTQGFWATHPTLLAQVWNSLPMLVGGIQTDGMTAAEMTLCDAIPLGPSAGDVGPLTVAQVEGGFWSNIAKTSTGANRSAIDKARMQLLQQLLAAILNNQLFGSSPSGVSIDQAKAAYCGNNIQAIRTAMSAMAAFNESGDSGLFTPGSSADPKAAKALADYVFWDVLP